MAKAKVSDMYPPRFPEKGEYIQVILDRQWFYVPILKISTINEKQKLIKVFKTDIGKKVKQVLSINAYGVERGRKWFIPLNKPSWEKKPRSQISQDMEELESDPETDSSDGSSSSDDECNDCDDHGQMHNSDASDNEVCTHQKKNNRSVALPKGSMTKAKPKMHDAKLAPRKIIEKPNKRMQASRSRKQVTSTNDAKFEAVIAAKIAELEKRVRALEATSTVPAVPAVQAVPTVPTMQGVREVPPSSSPPPPSPTWQTAPSPAAGSPWLAPPRPATRWAM